MTLETSLKSIITKTRFYLQDGPGSNRYTPQALLIENVADDEDEDLSVGRESRIEELARKMMSKVDEEMAAKRNDRKRHPSEPTPRYQRF